MSVGGVRLTKHSTRTIAIATRRPRTISVCGQPRGIAAYFRTDQRPSRSLVGCTLGDEFTDVQYFAGRDGAKVDGGERGQGERAAVTADELNLVGSSMLVDVDNGADVAR